jgi:cbb3-type cytochrome oxidase maturation protein
MNLLPLLILLSLLLLIGGGIAFFWAVDHDQFEDMDTPGLVPLADAEPDRVPAADPPGTPAAGPAQPAAATTRGTDRS